LANDYSIDRRTKGVPYGEDDLRRAAIAASRWNILAEDVPLPVAVLRQAALDNNSRWMRTFVSETGVKLAPHGKTTMSPELFALQLKDGAWGITVATVQQMRVAREAGAQRIILANEIVGPRDIAYVLDAIAGDARLELYCLVDSPEGVSRLARAAKERRAGRPLRVLLELGYPGGRAGCRDVENAVAVARAIKAAEPDLLLCGVEGFEGLYQTLPQAEATPKVIEFLERIVTTARRLEAENLFGSEDVILTAGGSAYYDLVARIFTGANLRRNVQVVLRSGCYLTHDAGLYERSFAQVRGRSDRARGIEQGFQNALEVWAYVLSIPEQGRAILGAGRRDFGHDAGLPVPLKLFRPGHDKHPRETNGVEAVAVNDQHLHVTFAPGEAIRVGDMVALGVSHPCTTFDKWRLIFVVDDGYTVQSAIQTFF
jgi:D-serine dehydratase